MPLSRFEAERFRYYILAAQRLGSRQLHECLKPVGLTPAQSEVLLILNQWQPVTLKELGALLVCETGSPSRLIERLVRDGLVDKVPDPSDARYVLLRLTEPGARKVQAIRQIEERLYDKLCGLFSDKELSLVNAALEKMLSHYSVAEALINREFMKPGEEKPLDRSGE